MITLIVIIAGYFALTFDWDKSDVSNISETRSSGLSEGLNRPTLSGDYNCDDFSSHREAQRFYEENGGPGTDYYGLDRDRDGSACESL